MTIDDDTVLAGVIRAWGFCVVGLVVALVYYFLFYLSTLTPDNCSIFGVASRDFIVTLFYTAGLVCFKRFIRIKSLWTAVQLQGRTSNRSVADGNLQIT